MKLDKLHPTVQEDIEVGVENHTENIKLTVNVNRDSDLVSTDYTAAIDDDTKSIVVTPKDAKCFFSDEDTDDTTEIDLTVNMLSDSNNFEYDVNIDEIGQLVISPKSADTEFISLVQEDNLNLITDMDEPYDDAVCEEEIEYLTNRYDYPSGKISTSFEREKDCAVRLLGNHYDVIDVERIVDGDTGCWNITYANPKPNMTTLEEDTSIGDDEGDTWKVKYEFTMEESLNEDTESPDNSSVTVTASDAETALKYAQQYAIMKRRESPKWGNAEVVSINKQEDEI